jgi:DNA topoisomerase-3
MRTRRPFKAFLTWDAEAGKVNFAFEERKSKFPPRKTAGAATKTTAASRAKAKEPPSEYKASAKAAKAVAKKAPAAKKAAAKAPRKTGAGLKPSPELAAVVGSEPLARTEVIKKIWDYIKAKGLQDAKDKRAINADDKLRAVFGGKGKVSMFEMTKLVNKHIK